MSRSQQLLELQKLDLERDALVAEMARVLVKLKGNPAVVTAQRELDAAEESLDAIQPVLRGQDLERESVREHIAREEKKLYGGAFTAPKDLQNFEREIAALRRRLSSLDDEALETLVARDEAAERVASATAQLKRAEADAAEELGELGQRKAELAALLRQLDADRAEHSATIAPPDIERYDRLRKAKGGRAVAEARDGTCSACGMTLPRQDIDHVREGADLVPCPGCGRLLSA
ncbi:MAG: zinc ribbon domain-containing protein [Anaerolineae bacterium]|jgi:hypothetical protein